jgi:nucleotide-binding universal stress UspA family protein
MYRKILVPLDAGSLAQRCAGHALDLAAEHRAELRFLNVMDVHGFMGPYPNMIEVMSDDAVRMLDGWVQEASTRGLLAHSAIEETDRLRATIAQVIADDARAWGADLIVFGHKEHDGFMSHWQSTMASEVERCTTASVLILPTNARA